MEDANIIEISLPKLKKKKILKFKLKANKKYTIYTKDFKYSTYTNSNYSYVLIDYNTFLKKKDKIEKLLDKRILSFISNDIKLKFFNNLTKKEFKKLKKILK